MERKVLLTECMNRRVLALLEDEKVTEFHFGSSGEKKSCRLGEIYVGRVRKILPNIGGAFVEIANGEQCYFALDGKYTPVFTNKIGKKPLVIGDELLVQVEKEAVKTKQPVVTGNLNFTGQYVVLTSGNRTIGVSGKIHGARKEELQKLGQDYIDCDFGLIFRTNCVEAEETQIRTEIDKLAENYQNRRIWQDADLLQLSAECTGSVRTGTPGYLQKRLDGNYCRGNGRRWSFV